jgi:hypothetical protein
LPDHAPSNPANGGDWAWPAEVDSISAATIVPAFIVCPIRPEPAYFILNAPLNVTFPRTDVFSAHVLLCSGEGFGSKGIRQLPSAGIFLFCDRFSSLRDKLRQPHFFAREAFASSGILKVSPRGNRLAP